MILAIYTHVTPRKERERLAEDLEVRGELSYVESVVTLAALLRSRWLERLVVGAGFAYIVAMQVFNPLRSATSDAAVTGSVPRSCRARYSC